MTTRFRANYYSTDIFDLNRLLNNEQLSDKTIVERLQEMLSSQQLRSIIKRGIIAHCEAVEDYKLVITMNKALNNVSYNDSAPAAHRELQNCSIYHEVFAIQSLMCQIFTYLDVKSLCKAGYVNSQWLHDTHNDASVSYLRMNDMFRCEKKYVDNMFHDSYKFKECLSYETYYSTNMESYYYEFIPTFKNLNLFSNIQTIDMQFWWPLIIALDAKYLTHMQSIFEKIKHIQVIEPKWDTFEDDLRQFCLHKLYHNRDAWNKNIANGTARYGTLVENIIKKNSQHIESMVIQNENFKAASPIVEQLFGPRDTSDPQHQQQGEGSGVSSDGTVNKNSSNMLAISSCCGTVSNDLSIIRFDCLQKLCFKNVPFYLDTLNSGTLPNLKQLEIIGCRMNFAIEHLNKVLIYNQQTVTKIQSLFSRLTSMTFCGNYHLDPDKQDPKYCSVSAISLHFWLYVIFKNSICGTRMKLESLEFDLLSRYRYAQNVADATCGLLFENLKNLSLHLTGGGQSLEPTITMLKLILDTTIRNNDKNYNQGSLFDGTDIDCCNQNINNNTGNIYSIKLNTFSLQLTNIKNTHDLAFVCESVVAILNFNSLQSMSLYHQSKNCAITGDEVDALVQFYNDLVMNHYRTRKLCSLDLKLQFEMDNKTFKQFCDSVYKWWSSKIVTMYVKFTAKYQHRFTRIQEHLRQLLGKDADSDLVISQVKKKDRMKNEKLHQKEAKLYVELDENIKGYTTCDIQLV